MRGRQFAAALALIASVGSATAADAPKTWEGLELQSAKGLDLLYVRPATRFETYTSVVIDAPIEVAFDKDWDPNRGVRGVSRQLSARNIQQIRDEMATEFRKVFAEELARSGYAIVDQPGEQTLRVSASLADVYINAPERMEVDNVVTYTLEPGRMTLEMELRDGPTGQLLARVVDEKSGTNIGPLRVTNSMTNASDFRRAARSWAQRLIKALDMVSDKH
ncbi:MAG: DUF3313 family protein [Gammaproteobacteria bacterium]|nr:DUF3313 family protein [Gammaproteobacteria bacterium]